MKITEDINSISKQLSNINSDKNVKTAAKRNNITSDANIQNQISKNLQRERVQIDALIIAQVSRDIIQKAIAISSRLQSVASEAFTTGKIDIQEVQNQVSFIEKDIADYGNTLSTPVNIPLPDQSQKENTFIEQFNRLKNSGQDMLAGEKINPKIFGEITENLTREYDSLGKSIDAYYSGLKITNRGSAGADAAETAGNSLSHSIGQNPVQALYAQGNLNQEIAKNLAMA